MVRYHNSGTQKFDDTEHDSVKTDDATVSGLAVGSSVEQGQTRTTHDANNVSVSANSYSTIFDLTDPVTVLGGVVNGVGVAGLRVTYSDGTTELVGGTGFHNGLDGAGDQIAVTAIPTIRDVKTLEFYNNLSSANDFGYWVLSA